MIFIMFPEILFGNCFSNLCISSSGARRFIFMFKSHVFFVKDFKVSISKLDALFIKHVIRPNFRFASWTKLSISSSTLRLACIHFALPPCFFINFSSWRASCFDLWKCIVIAHPFFARCRAIPLPILFAAPVIITFFLLDIFLYSLNIISLSWLF